MSGLSVMVESKERRRLRCYRVEGGAVMWGVGGAVLAAILLPRSSFPGTGPFAGLVINGQT